MPAKLVSLHNIDNELIYPETIVTAVHMPDGQRNLIDAIADINDESCTYAFNNSTGGFTKTMTSSSMVITVTFSGNTVTEVCKYSDDTTYYTKTTTYNSNGSVTVSKVYADNT